MLKEEGGQGGEEAISLVWVGQKEQRCPTGQERGQWGFLGVHMPLGVCMCAYECARYVHVCVRMVVCEHVWVCRCLHPGPCDSLTACVCSPPPPVLLKALRCHLSEASPQADLAGARLAHYPHFTDEKVKVK